MATARSVSAPKGAEVVAEESVTVPAAVEPVTIEQVKQAVLDAMADAMDASTGFGSDLVSVGTLANIYSTLEGK